MKIVEPTSIEDLTADSLRMIDLSQTGDYDLQEALHDLNGSIRLLNYLGNKVIATEQLAGKDTDAKQVTLASKIKSLEKLKVFLESLV